MSNLSKSSQALPLDVASIAATQLLANYSFDLGRYTAAELVNQWLSSYPANWVLLAAIEALYQGRYKAKSVEQILTIWMRRQQPLYHFNYEFERLICSKLLAHLIDQSEDESVASSQPATNLSVAPAKIATRTPTKEAFQYASPFDAMSGATTNVDSTSNIVLPQQAEPNIASNSTNTERRISTDDTWASSKIGPIDKFEPTEVDPYLYTKLKTLADSD